VQNQQIDYGVDTPAVGTGTDDGSPDTCNRADTVRMGQYRRSTSQLVGVNTEQILRSSTPSATTWDWWLGEPVQRHLELPPIRRGAGQQRKRPARGLAMRSPTNQKGAVLLVALIMLVVFTLWLSA
jgi:hypothetical protein